jgi:hypothetical protein
MGFLTFYANKKNYMQILRKAPQNKCSGFQNLLDNKSLEKV